MIEVIAKADKLRNKLDKTLAPINKNLAKLLDDPNAIVFYQTDGWCIAYEVGVDVYNTPAHYINLDTLFSMTKNEALEYLKENSI